MRKLAVLSLTLLLAGAGVAAADEAKARSASLLVDLTAARASSRDTAYLESLKPGSSVTPRPASGEVQEDGSVRYGNVTVTVRNPCPPGHDEPMPLPGRRK